MENKTIFLKHIAILQAITIILVVAGHSFHLHPDVVANGNLGINVMMKTFRMPTFMFASGFLMMYTTFMRGKIVKPTKFLGNKFQRLLIPFFVLTLVIYIPRCLLSGIADNNMELGYSNFIKAFIYPDSMPIPQLWFLHASFTLLVTVYLLLYLSFKIKCPLETSLIILSLIGALLIFISPDVPDVFSLNHTAPLAFYFVLGSLCANYYKSVIKLLSHNTWGGVLLSFTLWIASWFFLNDNLSYICCGICGIAMLFCLSLGICNSNIGLFDNLIGTNYIIFLLSWFFNVFSQQILAHFFDLPWYVHSLLSVTTGIIGPVIILRWMVKRRHIRLVWIVGKALGQNLAKDF